MLQSLTDALLKATARPSKGKRLELVDMRSPGLAFRVTDKGVKSFAFRFRCPTSGRVNRMTLGRYPDLTLGKARQRADDLRGQVANGVNPADVRRREKDTAASRSFGAVAERYMEEHARRHKAASSAEGDERMLRLHVLPKWKNRHIATLRRADAIELIEGIIADGKHVLANRVHALVSKIFTFALDGELVATNPMSRLRKRGSETPAKRVLSNDEIVQFWPRCMLSPLSPRAGLALRLMLLTGARPGEAAGLRREELQNLDDAASAVWLIPGERTKNRLPHAVPLTSEARKTIKAALELTDKKDKCVFPSPTLSGEPMRPHSLTVGMKRMAKKIEGPSAKGWKAKPPTPHDLRRTFRTRLSALGVRKDIRDRLMNHAPGDVGERHYDQHEFLAEKREALTTWAAALAAILSPTRA